MRKKMALTALGLGAAYLMRNKEARDKLSSQFDTFSGNAAGNRNMNTMDSRSTHTTGRRRGLLGNLFS
ncbi:hypothetical protein AB1K83_14785 [Sporosarcina sp. 179-K 3D1 HS]|uniref:hypothetical protein n=1 Tax=Sporosarcina sp. 179-K 3D1 HS TaxID=3232169 RepID=UPI0039A17689